MNKLGEYVILESGNGFPEIYQGNHSGKYPFIKVSDFNLRGNETQINVANNYVDDDLVQKLFLNIIPSGSTVFAKVGAAIYLNRRRMIIRDTILDNNLMAAIPKDINNEYLYHLLVSIDLTKFTQQGALPSLSNKIISNIDVNIPNKSQQQRIAKILTTADAVIEKTQAAIAKYKAIKQGMLQDLFTRGIDLSTNKLRPRYEDAPELYKESKLGWIPREWDDDVLGNIISVSSGEGLTQENIKPGIHSIYGGNGINGSHAEYLFEDSKLIIGRVGEYCGNAYITKPFSWVTDNALVVTPLKKDFFMDFWLYYLNYLDLNSFAFVGAQPVITGGLINKVVVKEISEDEQKIIAERLTAIDSKLQTEQTYLQKMQNLKKGLMEDLLSGRKQVKVAEELVTQNEN